MNSSSPRNLPDVPTAAAAERFARLLEMGFERVEPAVETIEAVRLDTGLHKVTQVRPAMGSFVAVTALHASQGLAEDAIGVAFAEMDRLIGLLNRFDAASALHHLNDTGHIRSAPPELREVVRHGLDFGRRTAGAFDITVKPLVDLFRDPATYAPRTPPSEAELAEALEHVGLEHVVIGESDVELRRPGMGLTLDGIAKGYIVDGMAQALRARGAERFLVNAGGDIRTGGDRGDETPWTIAIRDPGAPSPSWDSSAWDRGIVPGSLGLRDGAVATSGSYEIFCDSEPTAHHIVRTGDGRSPGEALSVTVTAPTTLQADALATAVFVLGPVQGTRLIDATGGCECLIIAHDGRRYRSAGWAGAPAREDT